MESGLLKNIIMLSLLLIATLSIVPPTVVAAPAPEAPQQKIFQSGPDAIPWEEVKKGNKVEGYQVNRYPSGHYIAAASAKLEALKEEEVKFTPPAMIRIPGKNYEIGKYDVTQKEWRDIMGSNPSHFSNCGDTCPVEQVSWNDVQAFIQKLNAKTGKQYRLPIEEEWEYACYGGSKTEYCGGNNLDSVAWYKDNSNGSTHPVGQKQANGYGLYDMSGNVWQWLQKEAVGGRALRGGSWCYGEDGLRVTGHNDGFDPYNRFTIYGFRLARTLS
jgi:formylglycine-generating enzyme required for sulfatase activity